MSRYAPGKPIIGRATTGVFTLTDIDGKAVTLGARERVVIYFASSEATDADPATITDGTNLLMTVANGVSSSVGVPGLPGVIPVADPGDGTNVIIHGEIVS